MFPEITLFGSKFALYTPVTNIGSLSILIWYICHYKYFRSMSTLSYIPQEFIIGKKKKFFNRNFLAFIESVFIFVVLFLPASRIGPAISYLSFGDRSDNFFTNIFFVPLGLLLLGVLLNVLPLKLLDFTAVPMIIALIFYKIACFSEGCCYGVPSEKFGMFNYRNQRTEFPVQLVEIICAVVMLIIIFSLWRKEKRKEGILYPLFILMYCSSRFVSEFWRDDYPDIFGPLKGYHILCIIGFIEGLIMLFVVLKWGKKISEYFNKKRQFVIERCRMLEELDSQKDSSVSTDESA